MVARPNDVRGQHAPHRKIAGFLLFALTIWLLGMYLGWEPWVSWGLAAAVGIVFQLDDGEDDAAFRP